MMQMEMDGGDPERTIAQRKRGEKRRAGDDTKLTATSSDGITSLGGEKRRRSASSPTPHDDSDNEEKVPINGILEAQLAEEHNIVLDSFTEAGLYPGARPRHSRHAHKRKKDPGMCYLSFSLLYNRHALLT
jgi:hypothetical protein